MSKRILPQRGASLIEVLVSMLILSFGMLALSGMLAYAVQMPRLSAYRSTAVMLAAAHIERMRANPAGFTGGAYNTTMTYNSPYPNLAAPCVYPNCVPGTIADFDNFQMNSTLRRELPLGGMRMVCNGPCANNEGDLWVMWHEPTTFAALDSTSSDQCPSPAAAPPFAAAVFSFQPRCIHVRFRL